MQQRNHFYNTNIDAMKTCMSFQILILNPLPNLVQDNFLYNH